MDKRRRSQIAGGLLLILLGAFWLAAQFIPEAQAWLARIDWSSGWPLIVVGVGAFLLVFGLAVGEPGMAVPACIVGGIGGLLFWQNLTGEWESWSYAWALIPGFVGAGTILAGLLGGNARGAIGGGLWLIFISLVLFVIFGSFLGGQRMLGDYWPALLIVAGLFLLVRALLRPRPAG